jgi:site-specific recombinase XerD
MDEYDDFEAEIEKIQKENKVLLEKFATWLKEAGLSKKTITRHVSNIDFYINEFLVYEEPQWPEDGLIHIGYFLGYWFIKKAMWSSVAAIKANAASLKKFYAFMLEEDMIENEEFENLKKTIREEMPEWTATMRRYEDDSIEDMNEVWGI